jgi:hypothetical protein
MIGGIVELLGNGLFLEPLRRPNLRKTSEQVTKIEMMMRIMIIQVISIKSVSR